MPHCTNGSGDEAHERGIGFLERACPVRTAIDVISGRWKPSILEQLHLEPRRFKDLAAEIDGISSQALAQQLRQLTADGVVEKLESGLVSIYCLSMRGQALADIMDGLARWGESYLESRSAIALDQEKQVKQS